MKEGSKKRFEEEISRKGRQLLIKESCSVAYTSVKIYPYKLCAKRQTEIFCPSQTKEVFTNVVADSRKKTPTRGICRR